WFSTLEVAGQVLTELAYADLFRFHIAYPVYTIAYLRASRRRVRVVREAGEVMRSAITSKTALRKASCAVQAACEITETQSARSRLTLDGRACSRSSAPEFRS